MNPIMSKGTMRLGLIDSGISTIQDTFVQKAYRFTADEEGKTLRQTVLPDKVGHGTIVCDIITHHAPDIMLYNAQVFDDRGVTTANNVAAALDWLRAEKVDIVNLSLGLQQDRTPLREACAAAVAAGMTLIAASPAQGDAVFPSAYPGVIRATGDARCDITDISFLDSRQADFGGCPHMIGHSTGARPRIGGASLGTAHMSGHVASYLSQGGAKETIREWLVSQAKYIHSERRTE